MSKVRDYLKGAAVYVRRLGALAVTAGIAGAGTYVAQHGFDLDEASVRGLYTAVSAAVVGVVLKPLGDKDSPLPSK